MKTTIPNVIIRAVLALMLFCPNAHAEDLWKNLPKNLHWKGEMKGEEVEMTITMGDFVKAEHQVLEKDGEIHKVDGFNAEFASPSNGVMPPHITDWNVRWGGKQVAIPKGVFTSIFFPYLKGPTESFSQARKDSEVWIGASEDGEALLVIMVCGYDAQHSRIAFSISKDGKVHRFSLEFIS